MRRPNWALLAIALWAILLAVVCIKSLLSPYSGTVYITYLMAGHEFTAGRPLYNVIHPHTDNFRYPPVVAVGFIPMTFVPPGIGSAVWRLVGVAIFLSGIAAWARRLQPEISLPLMFLLALPLSIGSLSNAQANTHVAGLMLWGSALASRGRWVLAACLIAAAALFKGYPIALGGLIFLLAPIRFGLPLALAMAAGLALPYAFQSSDYVSAQYQSLFANLGNDDRTARPLFAGYQDFHMLLRVCGINIPRNDFMVVQAGMGLLAAGLIVWLRIRGMSRSETAANAFAIGTCWMCMFSPAVEASTYILMAPILAFELLQTRRPIWTRLAAYTGSALFFTSVIVFAFPHAIHQPVVALGILPVAACLLTIGCIGRVLAIPVQPVAIASEVLEAPQRLAA